jgi:hypothetical protein
MLPSKTDFTFTVRCARAPISGTCLEPTVLPGTIVTIAVADDDQVGESCRRSAICYSPIGHPGGQQDLCVVRPRENCSAVSAPRARPGWPGYRRSPVTLAGSVDARRHLHGVKVEVWVSTTRLGTSTR